MLAKGGVPRDAEIRILDDFQGVDGRIEIHIAAEDIS